MPVQSIAEFKIDAWVRDYGPGAKHQLQGSYAPALSLRDLQELHPAKKSPVDPELKLTYGQVKGSADLRRRIASLHSSNDVRLTEDHVVITPGSIMANYLVLASICGPGDHIICQFPTYGQLYLLPKHQGVDVDLWTMKAEDEWAPDVETLRRLIKPNTTAIIINNPNNPTGYTLSKASLGKVIDVARDANVTVFSDEVFSPLFHAPTAPPPPVVSLPYANSISTGSLSKSYGLPGIRIGWAVSQDLDLIQRIVNLRDYTTLSVSQIDDGIAFHALSPEVLPKLISRSLASCAKGLEKIEDFISKHRDRCRWIRPLGAGTAFIQVLDVGDSQPVDDVQLARRLATEKSVCVVPGDLCFGEDGGGNFRGYLRFRLGDPDVLEDGLRALGELL
ncbi:pyridoxal phosphate-dependent transferase [Diaporthe sp. PMI_573]|nr:pyridoxal phosphate-dependent transferase [Diaporthaceae sp. PMI_573]